MVQVVLVTAAFLSMLIFITFVLWHELGLAPVISAMLSVSAMAAGLLVAATVQHHFGLSMRNTAIVLALSIFVLSLAYEAVG